MRRLDGSTVWPLIDAGGAVPAMQELGRLLVLAGLSLAALGAVLWLGFGKGWLGQLPGDIHVERGGTSFHFPIVTCLLASLLLSLLLWLFRK